MHKILMLLLLCGSISAATLEEDVWKLADENYDVREAATEKLANYPLEYVNIFLAMSAGVKIDPEVQWRLRTAARLCYHKHVTMKSEDFLHEIMELDFESHARYLEIEEITREHTDPNTGQIHNITDVRVSGPRICYITSAWGDSGLKNHDCIMKVNGEDVATHLWRPTAGKVYEFDVRRFKIPDNEDDLPDDTTGLEFVDLKIKYTVGTKDKQFWNWERLDAILEYAWARYMTAYNDKYGSLDPKPIPKPIEECGTPNLPMGEEVKDDDGPGVVKMIIDALLGE